ncbi:MAG: chloride channel protein, partial [Pseudomonadota bacterium]
MPRTRPLKIDLTIRGFRQRLASIDAVPQFAFLGVIAGIVTGGLILLFRGLIEWPLILMLGDPEDFEMLGSLSRFTLPVAGAIVLGLILTFSNSSSLRVGVVHVMERLARFQGHLPWQNMVTQFFCGIIALASGQSGGREGPAIHLGAAGSSLLGQWLKLPNNSIRILVGCGAAAAISASFNTPIAGVIFSMEVIIMEYTIAGFIPVILAAVSAALIMQIVYGNEAAFNVPALALSSFYELPFLILLGILIGCLAAVFIRMIQLFYRHAPSQIWLRMTFAGVVTGVCAMAVPQILGVGYDTVNASLLDELPLILLLSICVFKMLSSAVTVGMGMPVGVIGPTLIIGATAGGSLGYLGYMMFPDHASSPGLYVMLGMGAMMGAALQAPLAALMAVMELTHNPNIILPAMLVIITANMTASQVFGLRSIFHMQMEMLGLEFRQNPLSQALNRASVASIMSRSFVRVKATLSHDEVAELLNNQPTWLLVHDEDQGPLFILRAEDLRAYQVDAASDQAIDLTAIPATRKDVSPVLLQATLGEALAILEETGKQALYVNRISAPMIDSVVGVLSRE